MAAANDLLTDALARVAESVPDVLEGLGTDDAAWGPDAEANSIGWLVWHLTRVLDSHIADAAGEEQVLVTGSYAHRLGLDLPTGDTGYAHGSDEVARVRFADLAELTAYHLAVQEMATSYLSGVSDFDRVVDERWDPPVTLGVRLVSVVDDCARHIGQAQYVRGLLERRG
jgi:hypothetical protein